MIVCVCMCLDSALRGIATDKFQTLKINFSLMLKNQLRLCQKHNTVCSEMEQTLVVFCYDTIFERMCDGVSYIECFIHIVMHGYIRIDQRERER